jgi:hypothetical protein
MTTANQTATAATLPTTPAKVTDAKSKSKSKRSSKPADGPVAVPTAGCYTRDQIRGAMIAAAVHNRYLIPSKGQVRMAEDAGYPIKSKSDGSYSVGQATLAAFVVGLYATLPGKESRDLQVNYSDGTADPIRTLANMVSTRRNRIPKLGQ